jgi:hypothetical protein
VRPLYIERRSRCKRCERSTGIPGCDFVPKDDSLPSISPRRLDGFSENYGDHDRFIQATLLDSYLPSPRIPSNRAARIAPKTIDLQQYDKAVNNVDMEKKATETATATGMKQFGVRRRFTANKM